MAEEEMVEVKAKRVSGDPEDRAVAVLIELAEDEAVPTGYRLEAARAIVNRPKVLPTGIGSRDEHEQVAPARKSEPS